VLFTAAFFRSRSNAGCKARDPIFVLGRPRSGSTLVEQILSCHPAIEGTAELPYVTSLARRLEEREGGYPEIVGSLDPPALTALGEEYVKNSRVHRRPGRLFFIDKNPANFSHTGLPPLILPNAKFIEVPRPPAPATLSMFKQYGSKPRLSLTG